MTEFHFPRRTSPTCVVPIHAARVLAGFFALAASLILSAFPARAADASSGEAERSVVAVFSLNGPLTEIPADETFPFFGPAGTSLKQLVSRLDKAANDPDVKAVVLLPEDFLPGPAQIEELREAVDRIRNHGKEVYVHADSLMMAQYLLASDASRISLVPTGMLLIPGLHASSLHVRGLLDKIGVKPDFLTEGAYKSAAELFTREQPSPEADEMMNWLMDSLYKSFVAEIAKGRKVDESRARGWIDDGLFTAEQAKAAGLIDAVEERQEFETMLKEHYGNNVVFDKKYGRKNQPELDLNSPLAFFKIWGDLVAGAKKKSEPQNAIGVIYVNGPIFPGKGMASPFGGSIGAFSDDIRNALEKAAADDSVKAVVLRIDSPGGSATASQIILDATKRLKAKKPLVVSMGDMAGSGGYFVACGADTIFADAATLTGSIGVVGGKLATTEMWNKIGVTFKEYKRGKNAGIFSTDDVFTDSERARVRQMMDDVYAAFKKHVTDIRGDRLKKPIEELAGGRVYTGRQALDLGLVDRLGTLNDAVALAADKAGIKNYDVRVIPAPKSFLQELMEQFSGGENDESGHVEMTARENSFVKLAAPYLQNLDSRRTAAVFAALRELPILQSEGVMVTMPAVLEY